MARTAKNTSIYEKLNKNEQDIINAENLLKTLKSEREILLQEKDDYEMRKIWAKIKEQELTYDQAEKILVKSAFDIDIQKPIEKTKKK